VLDNDLIARLRETVPAPLVHHGSSGVADENLAQAVTCGITKVNIGTILNIAFTNAVRYFLTHKSNTPHLSEVVTNDNQIVTECVDCDHFPREGLVQVGVMLSLLRKRFIGS
jgi:fructose/tagatose bisphosphate aldolase